MTPNIYIKYFAVILFVWVGVSCQVTTINPPANDMLFCAQQAVYAVSIESDGRTPTRKILDLPDDSTCPVWSPDGKLALLYRTRQNGFTFEDGLSLIERQTGAIHEVYRFGPRDDEWAIRWLPDGISLLIFSARDYQGTEDCSELFASRTFNGTKCWGHYADAYLTDIHLRGFPTHFERLTASPSDRCGLLWSPDGRRVAYTRGGCAGGMIAQNLDILDTQAHGEKALISGEADNATFFLNGAIQWSPNGEQLLVKSKRSDDNQWLLHAANVTSSEIRKITPDGTTIGYWSPDGKKLVWWRESNQTMGTTDSVSGRSKEWTVSKDTASDILYLMLSRGWSPDSQRFAWIEWINRSEGKAELRVIDLASGKTASLATLRPNNWVWSPDNKWLAFSILTPVDPNMGKYRIDIYTVKPNGTDLRYITDGQQLSALQRGPIGWGWRWYNDEVSDVQWVPR